jgi:hypothetical protein
MKDNALYTIVEKRDVAHNRSVLKDQIIWLSGSQAWEKCPYALRRVEVWDEEKQQALIFLTNHFEFGASTIAAIYKERWQIELFFKALKQNLKIKTFVGTSANAVKIQVWTALIAILILRYLQLKSKFSWSLSNLVAILRMNLFTYRDLWPTLWRACADSGSTPAGGFDVSIIRTASWESGFKMTQNPSKYAGKSMVASLKPG